ncbi:GNAT family N-acetyltransferase [Anaerosporobacter sp.]
MNIKEVSLEDMNYQLFNHFKRHQEVTKCYRKIAGEWIIKDVPFIDEWSEEDYQFLVTCLRNTIVTGGVVYGAFEDNQLKGFASVEPTLFGTNKEYLDLSSIHVSEDMRGNGIGRTLFQTAADWAKNHGAKKLYISAHSAVETQAFYKEMGCVEAAEYNADHVEKEPFDCQLEYIL